MKRSILLLIITVFISCKNSIEWKNYDESNEIIENSNHPNKRMQFKLIQSGE